MAKQITKEQYEEIYDVDICCGVEECNKLLDEYARIEARPYTVYEYFDANGNYIGNSYESDLDDLLKMACVEVRNG